MFILRMLCVLALVAALGIVACGEKSETEAETALAEGGEAVKATLEEGAEAAGKALEEGAKTVGEKLEEGAEAAGEALEEGAKTVGEKLEEGKRVVDEKIEEGAKVVDEKIQEGADILDESLDTLKGKAEGVKKLLEGLGEDKEVVSTPSGLQYVDLMVGDGPTPESGETCSTHATLWLLDGTKIWSSRDGGRPFDFKLDGGQVIKGWNEGVSTMKAGGMRRLLVPSDLGYGPRGRHPVPPDADLVFEIELLEIKK